MIIELPMGGNYYFISEAALNHIEVSPIEKEMRIRPGDVAGPPRWETKTIGVEIIICFQNKKKKSFRFIDEDEGEDLFHRSCVQIRHAIRESREAPPR